MNYEKVTGPCLPYSVKAVSCTFQSTSNALVKPVLLNGCEVWAHGAIEEENLFISPQKYTIMIHMRNETLQGKETSIKTSKVAVMDAT